MYLSFRYALLAVLTSAVCGIMVELADRSFVTLERRVPKTGLPIRLANLNDTAYVASVLMGTPLQTVRMSPSMSQNVIAIASAPMGVYDPTYYRPALSSSYSPSNDYGNVPTNNGNVTGRFVGELCMLKSSAITWNFTYQASLVLTDAAATNEVYPVGARGILGYGVKAPPTSPLNASLFPTFFPDNATNAVCGIELNHADDPVPDGILTMGAVDPSAFTGNFTNVLVPRNSSISWTVPFDGLQYLSNGTTRNVSGLVASIDLFYTDIKVSTDIATQIYAGVNGSQRISDTQWSIPCGSKFPITLTLSGTSFLLNERDTIVKLPNGTCQGVISGGSTGVARVGAPFMRNVYTQIGAQQGSDGSLSYYVGFATKNLRLSATSTTDVGQPTPTVPSFSGASRRILQGVRLLSTLTVTLILVINLL